MYAKCGKICAPIGIGCAGRIFDIHILQCRCAYHDDGKGVDEAAPRGGKELESHAGQEDDGAACAMLDGWRGLRFRSFEFGTRIVVMVVRSSD